MYLFAVFCYATVWASFSTCYAYRYAHDESIFYPGSYCDYCHHPLNFWQLIPILGFCLQRGRCYYCHHKISLHSTLVELTFGLYMLSLFASKAPHLWASLSIFCAWSLLLALSDYLTQSVPAFELYLGGLVLLTQKLSWPPLEPGCSLCFLVILVGATYLQLLGSGDLIYLGFLWASFGIQFLLATTCLASCLALCYFSLKKDRPTSLAFIPFLTTASFILLYFLV